MTADYVMGHDPFMLAALGRRRGENLAAFLLPHLRPGQRLLDIGCGPGSVTVDLAARVAPGPVLGLDLDPASLAVARTLARERGQTRATFVLGDARTLPLRDASVDAVSLVGLLTYQGDHVPRVLAEVRRVLAPGGVVAASDSDYGSVLLSPCEPALGRAWELVLRVLRARGAEPFAARGQRARLRAAGFTRVSGSAVAESWGDAESTREVGYFWAWFLGRRHADWLVAQGGVSPDELREAVAAFVSWGQHPDASLVRCRCEALGFKPLDG
jgi:SAM-dependent methyltransferase